MLTRLNTLPSNLYLKYTSGFSSSNQHPIESMEKNISHNRSKSSMTHSLKPSLIQTSLDPKYHSTVILKNKSENGTIQAPPSIPPKPNPNEEPPDIGDMDMDKVEEDSSGSEYMEESEDDESETSDESQFFVEEDNMEVNQQGFEPLE